MLFCCIFRRARSVLPNYSDVPVGRQIGKSLPEPDPMPKLKVVKNGVTKAQVSQPPKRVRLLIMPSILGKIKQLWTPQENDPDIIMLWATSCVCLFGFFRAGEITVPTDDSYNASRHLNFQDLAVDDQLNPSLLRTRLKYSKPTS